MRINQALFFASIAAFGHAYAGPGSPLEFVVVDNGGINDASGANLAVSDTFDVFVRNNTGAAISGIVGFDFGSQATGQPTLYGIPVAGTVFNHPFGGDGNPSPALIPAFPALAFDSYWTIAGQAIAFEPGSADLVGSDGLLNGQFMLNAGSIDLDPSALVRVARLTFTSGGVNLDQGFGFDAILATGGRVSFGVPTPGAASLLAFAGLSAARRRRSR